MGQPGWGVLDGARESPVLALGGSGVVAHIVAKVVSDLTQYTTDDEHHLFECRIQDAYVRSEYWDGKLFRPLSPETPPYLTFFGSQTFGVISCEAIRRGGRTST